MSKAEALSLAKDEIKRADHLMFVSLKYTRTVDVIKSLIDRMINALDMCMIAVAEHLKEKGKIDSVPKTPGLRIEMLRKKKKNDELTELIDFYLLLKKINKAEFTRYKEFRRRVKMIIQLDGEEMDIDLDLVQEYYAKTKEFIPFIEELVH
jgi:hypothetical protein